MIRFEMFSRIKGTLIWALSFILMIVAGMNKMMVLSSQGDHNMDKLLESLPRAMRVIYGMEGHDLTNSIGYSGLMLFFILIMLAFHGVFLGTSLLGRESQEKTVDFIFVKPRSRARILFYKVLAGTGIVLFLQLIIGISFYSQMKEIEPISLYKQMILASLVTHLMFLFLGVALSIAITQRENTQKVALVITLLTYILVVIGQLYEFPSVEKATPIGFFPKSLFCTCFYRGIAITAIFTLVILGLAFIEIEQREFAD